MYEQIKLEQVFNKLEQFIVHSIKFGQVLFSEPKITFCSLRQQIASRQVFCWLVKLSSPKLLHCRPPSLISTANTCLKARNKLLDKSINQWEGKVAWYCWLFQALFACYCLPFCAWNLRLFMTPDKEQNLPAKPSN